MDIVVGKPLNGISKFRVWMMVGDDADGDKDGGGDDDEKDDGFDDDADGDKG